ncbi:hypothetical protein [Streptomyces rochei]|uniref:hypothetical protein n=1 Tax=Streptomyces rochei TaxID=1928 RepID=UPI00373F3F1C
MRLCDCCGKPIKGKAREIVNESGSGAAPNSYVCPIPCRPASPRQTYPQPSSPRWRRSLR